MSHPHQTKEEVLTAYRRSALLESARKVFGQCSFEAATMDRIARGADVAKGTIYLYYPSKQSIYDAVLHTGFDELEQFTRARLSRAASPRDSIAAFISARADYFGDRRDFFRMYVAAIGQHVTHPGGTSHFQAWIDRQHKPLHEVIARAVARREIRAVDAAAISLAIFDLTRGLVARRLMDHTSDPAGLRNEVTILTDLIWKGLAPVGTPRTAGSRRIAGKAKKRR